VSSPKFLTLSARDASTLAGIAAFGDSLTLRKRLSKGAPRRISRILLGKGAKRSSRMEREIAAEVKAYMTLAPR
jgi:hypothetical protein